MATKPSKKLNINLIPQKGLESTTSGRILLWILSGFRVIVIATEIIVMVAFLSRFWLDAKNTDLSEEMSQKQRVLIASSGFEKEFKYTQNKLRIFSELTSNKLKMAEAFKTITSYLPPDAYLTTISFSDENITISGFSPNERSIQQIIVNLETVDQFKKVALPTIKTSSTDSYLLEFKIVISTTIDQKTQETI